MPGFRRALWAVAAGAAVLVALDVAIAITSERELPVLRWSAPCVGATFVAAGIVAWRRRPSNRIGPLLTAAGYGWLLGGLTLLDDPLAFTVGLAAIPPSYALIAHTYLVFPHGRLRDRREAALIGATYAFVAVATLLTVGAGATTADTVFGERVLGCRPCPESVIGLGGEPLIGDIARWMAFVAWAVVPLGLVALLVRRWRDGDARYRAAIAPALAVGPPGMALLAIAALAPEAAVPERQLTAAGLILVGLLPVTLVWVLLRGGFAHADGVERLVPGLEDPGRGDEFSALVARALGDPTARVLLWDPERRAYVGEHGEPVPPGAPERRARTPVRRGRRSIAAIEHEDWLLSEGDVVRRVGEVLALAIDNQRLTAERTRALGEARASRRRIVTAGDTERERIARDIHDTAQRRLMLLAMEAHALAQRAAERDAALAARLSEFGDRLDATNDRLRALVRRVMPPILTDRGLPDAIDVVARGMPIPVTVTRPPPDAPRPTPDVERAAYFVVAEALANVARHARASSVAVTIGQDATVLAVEVRDDGVGGADAERGSGLRGIADRVAACGGTLEVASPLAGGTTVRARFTAAAAGDPGARAPDGADAASRPRAHA